MHMIKFQNILFHFVKNSLKNQFNDLMMNNKIYYIYIESELLNVTYRDHDMF